MSTPGPFPPARWGDPFPGGPDPSGSDPRGPDDLRVDPASARSACADAAGRDRCADPAGVDPGWAGLDDELEAQIGRWRGFVHTHASISTPDAEELEEHLRDVIADLRAGGLSPDEAFLVAVRRMGRLDEVSREFAVEHSERLWKQLVLAGDPADEAASASPRDLAIVIGLALGAAVAVKVPTLFGKPLDDSGSFYALNLSLFALPCLAAMFAWKRGIPATRAAAMLGIPFLIAAVLVNVYPFDESGSTVWLTAIHLPIVLWFVVGLAYVGGRWRDHRLRMDFIRFTGEWVVYYTLLALGGGVLIVLTAAGFDAIGRDIEAVLTEWVLPCGAMGAVVVAGWLVEAKQSVVENIAPVLTAVFTPLTTLMLLAYLVALVSSGSLLDADRDLLILADLILVLVLGLVLYAISARDRDSRPGPFDRLQLLLLAAALAIDVLMLAAMASRIGELGVTPNRMAALGLNLVLLVNLGWAARLAVGFLRGQPFAQVERWQTTYLPVFAIWASVVAALFPLAFAWA